MTNFTKRGMLERDMVSSIPSAGRDGIACGENFDDECEPLRPSMRGNSNERIYEEAGS